MFTAGCCIICLSVRNWVSTKVKGMIFDYACRKMIKQGMS